MSVSPRTGAYGGDEWEGEVHHAFGVDGDLVELDRAGRADLGVGEKGSGVDHVAVVGTVREILPFYFEGVLLPRVDGTHTYGVRPIVKEKLDGLRFTEGGKGLAV